MRGGEVVARWTRYDTGLLMFLLRQRRAVRWNSEGAHFANLRPGHPVYERLQREWERQRAIEAAANHEEVIQSLNAKLELMRQRQLAAIARAAGGEDDGDNDEDDDGA